MSNHQNTKAWYIIQIMEPNQSDWWDLSAPAPVGNDPVSKELGFMYEQKNKNPDCRYRLVIKHETVIEEAS